MESYGIALKANFRGNMKDTDRILNPRLSSQFTISQSGISHSYYCDSGS